MRVGAALGVLLAAGGSALAQNPPVTIEEGYSVERFRLATDKSGILDVESAEVGERMELELGLWLGYADDPLNIYQEGEIERERVASLVSHRLGGDLIGAVSLGYRLQVAVDLPLILSQAEDRGELMTAGPRISGFGLGDVRVVPKLQLVAPPAIGPGVGVAVALGATIPTGTEDNYFGDDGGTLTPEVILGARMTPRTRLGVNLGYRVRRENRALDLEINDEVYAHLGLAYRATRELELLATFAIATAASAPFDSADAVYSELHGGASYRLGRASLFAALGVGTTEGFGAPDWRVVSGLRFDLGRDGGGDRLVPEPQLLLAVKTPPGVGDPDSDLDGKLDSLDDCPNVPEDVDGFEDSDGCPDLDNDLDLVPDVDDACPLEPGPASNRGCAVRDRDGDGVRDGIDNCPDEAGPADNHGCVKKQLVVLSDTEIAILQPVLFRTNEARIRLRSYPLLRNIADVLKNHPDIAKLRIEGHTDSQGSSESNLDLSQRRADTVRDFLIAQGVDAARLEAAGRGEDAPIADNETAEGRAKNRRVDFVIGPRQPRP